MSGAGVILLEGIDQVTIDELVSTITQAKAKLNLDPHDMRILAGLEIVGWPEAGKTWRVGPGERINGVLAV
jgi:hypothetical protein